MHLPCPPLSNRIPGTLLRIVFIPLGVLGLARCTSTAPKYEKIKYSENKLSTPPHNMSQRDYPFDSDGRYRKDWVKSGSRTRSGSSSSSGSSRTSSPPRTSSSSSTSVASAPRPAPPKPKPAASPRYHTVRKGDTLYSIGRRYGSTVTRLKSVNGLGSDLIKIGQTLRIP